MSSTFEGLLDYLSKIFSNRIDWVMLWLTVSRASVLTVHCQLPFPFSSDRSLLKGIVKTLVWFSVCITPYGLPPLILRKGLGNRNCKHRKCTHVQLKCLYPNRRNYPEIYIVQRNLYWNVSQKENFTNLILTCWNLFWCISTKEEFMLKHTQTGGILYWNLTEQVEYILSLTAEEHMGKKYFTSYLKSNYQVL